MTACGGKVILRGLLCLRIFLQKFGKLRGGCRRTFSYNSTKAGLACRRPWSIMKPNFCARWYGGGARWLTT